MPFENVRLEVGGRGFEGWKSVAVRAALNEAARAFQVSVTEVPVTPGWGTSPFEIWNFPPGTPITITAGGSVLLTGYVDDYEPSGDAERHDVVISGRGKGADYTDSSIKHETGRFEDKTVLQIARELDRFGVGIVLEGLSRGLAVVPWFQIRQGSTPWAEMMRLLPQHQMTMKGRADGSIALTAGGETRHAGGLIQGHNILAMRGLLSGRDRFSEYTVKGQSALGVEDDHLKPKGTVYDPLIGRERPRIVIDSAETDRNRAQERAEWMKGRARGFSARATITAPGFRDQGGQLWEPGWKVYVQSPWLKLDQDMVIEAVDFMQDEAGTVSQLSLVGPEAYGGSTGASGSGSMWG